jgi:hypothetical protein
MPVITLTGTGHGDLNHTHDVDHHGEDTLLGSACELALNGSPMTGTATVWVSNLYTEALSNGKLRLHYRVRADWGSDIRYQVTLIYFKAQGGPFG